MKINPSCCLLKKKPPKNKNKNNKKTSTKKHDIAGWTHIFSFTKVLSSNLTLKVFSDCMTIKMISFNP